MPYSAFTKLGEVQFDPAEVSTLYDVFVSGEDGAAAGAVRPTIWPGVELVAGDIECARYDEFTGLGCEQRLKTALRGLDGYDLIFIDCPRALGAITSAALTASTKVLVVAEPTKDSLKGVGMLLETAVAVCKYYNSTLAVVGVVLNRLGPPQRGPYGPTSCVMPSVARCGSRRYRSGARSRG